MSSTSTSNIPTESDWSSLLGEILKEFQCVTGTLHRVSAASSEQLELLAQQGIPPFLLDKISLIPFGKGIAGCAAERREAVQMCNLQQDSSGIARPDAAQTKVEGALAVPLLMGEKVVGVLGIGKMESYEFSHEETERLKEIAAKLVHQLT